MGVKPGYKRTEVGVIPKEWEVAHLGTQLSEPIRNGYSPVCPEQVTGRWMLSLSAVSADGFKTAGVKPAPSHDPRVDDNLLTEGDLLVSRSNTPDRVGLAGVYEGHPAPCAYPDLLMRVRLKRSLDRYFLLRCLLSPRGRKFFADNARGSSGSMVKIDRAILESFPIPTPPLMEQRAIATALSDVDALLTQLDRLIAKKRDIKQAVMQELLTGKTRLPGFGGEWVNGRLDEVALVDPESLSGSTEPDYSFNYISLENVARGTLVGYSEELFASAPSRARRVIRHVDILVSTVRPNLKSHLLFRAKPGAWICSTGFSVIRCRPEIAHPEFVFQHLFADNITKQIDALLTGSNYPAINSSDVRGLTIPIPSIEEQTAIATLLSDLDAELAALEARRDKTRALKQGMMQELLTGRTRLV